jgi:hypothetical protein
MATDNLTPEASLRDVFDVQNVLLPAHTRASTRALFSRVLTEQEYTFAGDKA